MKQRVLIADGNHEFAKELASALDATGIFDAVDIALDGEQAIRMVKERLPDVLVIDLLLTIYDGLTVLEEIAEIDPQPVVIASSPFISDYVTAAAMQLRVRYLIKKPYKAETLVNRIRYVSSQKYCEKNIGGIEQLVADTLRDIGVPILTKGFQYLIPAIAIVANNEHSLDDISRALYEPIARYHNTTPTRVERAIQIAIEDTWNHNNPDVLQFCFDYTTCLLKEIPNNRDFISALADRIRFQLQLQNIMDK